MAFERDLEGASTYRSGSVSPPLPQQDGIYHKQEASIGNTAVQNSTDTSSFLENPLPEAPIPDPSLCVPTVLSPFYLHWFHLHVLFCTNTSLDRGQNHCWPHEMRKTPAFPQLKGPLPQLWEGEAENRAAQHQGKDTKAHISCRYTDPQEFCWLPVYMCRAQHCSGCSCSNLSVLSVQQNTTLTPAPLALHCCPLSSSLSRVWLACCPPCLNFLSHQSSASVLFGILKWTSVWQQ